MNRRSKSHGQLARGAALSVALTMAFAANAQAQRSLLSATVPGGTFEGRPVATKLPDDVKRLIDAVRRLHEEPGLILNRRAIYAALEVRPAKTLGSKSNDGSRHFVDYLIFDNQSGTPGWKGSLRFLERPERSTWSIRVKLDYYEGIACYPSTLVEAYWGKPFVFRPLGVHGPMRAGPHDGVPYSAGFWSPHPNSANVSFLNGRGGCLGEISAGQQFNRKDYSDDDVYHE